MMYCDDKPHEECGVFGVYSLKREEVARDIYYGLTALQHRGQESCGIAVSDTAGAMGNISVKKDMGLVSEVFHKGDLDALHGNIGVGHVRYSTTGGSTKENAQPIAMNYIKGCLALVHNGNIVNAAQLKEAQMYRGQAHYTTSDTEVLAYEIISERVKCGTIEEAVKNYDIPLAEEKNVKIPEAKVEVKTENTQTLNSVGNATEQRYIICPYCNHRLEIE